jgi:anthranilate synthase component 1
VTAFAPSLDELRAARARYGRAVLGASVIADGDTPLSLFARLEADAGGAFLFESVEGGERTGRWSFFGSGLGAGLELRGGEVQGFGGVRAAEIGGDPLDPVRAELTRREAFVGRGLPPFTGGLVGFVGADALASFERVPLPPPAAGAPDADAALLAVDDLYAYDHATHRLHALTRIDLRGDLDAELARARARLEARLARLAEPIRLAPFSSGGADPDAVPRRAHRSPADYARAVREAKTAIAAGEVFQVVVSQRWSVEARVRPLALYRALRALNPSPYMFLLTRPSGPALVGASPEVMVKVEAGDVLVRPIAGTRKRGATLAEDLALERELLADAKERAEHTMLLDLGRNDVGRVAASGTVRVEAPMHVERYAHVMHLVSDVHGQLDAGKDALDAFRAGFPAGTVVGAPKLRAAELLAALEPHRRGPYAGAVGYFDHAGGMDTCIAIRTLVVHPDRIDVQAGAGIVHDSDPRAEHEECVNKARSPFAAIALALSGETASSPRETEP